jgi:hypothetical protein
VLFLLLKCTWEFCEVPLQMNKSAILYVRKQVEQAWSPLIKRGENKLKKEAYTTSFLKD